MVLAGGVVLGAYSFGFFHESCPTTGCDLELAKIPPAKDPDVVVGAGQDCGFFHPDGLAAFPSLMVYKVDYKAAVVRGSLTCGAAVAAFSEAYTQVRVFDVEFTTAAGWNCVVVESGVGQTTARSDQPMECRRDATELVLLNYKLPNP
ncbi:hypothetical protein ACFVUS_33400 [Nocardia sp. NPDC058058]|uniref:hypothetical protein n=1 Tax=Nocardia sp. NPDC058058 TaxID=3346317 RepID=UPI0036DA1917